MARASATHIPRNQRADLEQGPHEAIAAYLDLAWPKHLPWTHFPAGEARDRVTRVGRDGVEYTYSPAGARLKRMGLKPSWFDMQFVLPNGQFATAEIKSADGKLDEGQLEHWRKCRALGVMCAIWRSPEDCEHDITRWLAAFQLKPLATLGSRVTL